MQAPTGGMFMRLRTPQSAALTAPLLRVAMKKEAAREAMLRGTTSFSSVLANELPTFADTGSFACKTTEVVQFCTTDDTVANDFDFSEARGMYQESTFNTNTVGNAADSESFADTAVLTANNDTFKNLYTFAIAFDNLYVNFDCITRAECRDIVTKLFLFKYADNVHFFFPPIRHSCPRCRHLSRQSCYRAEDCLN